ncbi:Adenine nucleotide alpha hydrolase-like superfamily protein [Zea mays]|uniref:Adenine nucleotide alpha hydrolase-like superfamily protein n=1 Tax=Zea mays TaxID=4577 RepID=A0A1D6G7R0_MAIZE|nr:Adenine nucleotide alpha hydrolase-like superfamily protein [Zea mays]AQK99192.1 Adenine nucleotide alpha hydrolase-like superfamily protein [Zea mays]
MASSAEERFLRQLSASNGGDEGVCGGQQLGHKEYCAERRGSRRWSRKRAAAARGYCGGYDDYDVKQQAEAASAAARKRVIVVVDDTSGSKHAMMWALTHVASKGDFLTLLHVLLPHSASGGGCSRGEEASSLANSLGTLCKASRPEVRICRHTCTCVC